MSSSKSLRSGAQWQQNASSSTAPNNPASTAGSGSGTSSKKRRLVEAAASVKSDDTTKSIEGKTICMLIDPASMAAFNRKGKLLEYSAAISKPGWIKHPIPKAAWKRFKPKASHHDLWGFVHEVATYAPAEGSHDIPGLVYIIGHELIIHFILAESIWEDLHVTFMTLKRFQTDYIGQRGTRKVLSFVAIVAMDWNEAFSIISLEDRLSAQNEPQAISLNDPPPDLTVTLRSQMERIYTFASHTNVPIFPIQNEALLMGDKKRWIEAIDSATHRCNTVLKRHYMRPTAPTVITEENPLPVVQVLPDRQHYVTSRTWTTGASTILHPENLAQTWRLTAREKTGLYPLADTINDNIYYIALPLHTLVQELGVIQVFFIEEPSGDRWITKRRVVNGGFVKDVDFVWGAAHLSNYETLLCSKPSARYQEILASYPMIMTANGQWIPAPWADVSRCTAEADTLVLNTIRFLVESIVSMNAAPAPLPCIGNFGCVNLGYFLVLDSPARNLQLFVHDIQFFNGHCLPPIWQKGSGLLSESRLNEYLATVLPALERRIKAFTK